MARSSDEGSALIIAERDPTVPSHEGEVEGLFGCGGVVETSVNVDLQSVRDSKAPP